MKATHQAVAALALATITTLTSAQTTYTVTDLGSLGSFHSAAHAISSNGHIVGAAITPQSSYELAVRFSTAPIVLTGEGISGAVARAVNSDGTIVGYSDSIDLRAFAIRAGTLYDLGRLEGFTSQASGINTHGLIVGNTSDLHGFSKAASWSWNGAGYTLSPLTDLGGFSSAARAVNDHAMIVGYADVPGSISTPCYWINGVASPINIPGMSYGEATAVNNNGQVVGYAFTPDGTVAFFWSAAQSVTNMGTLGGMHAQAYAINTHGQAVGSSYLPSTDVVLHAFTWKDGVMTDLNTLIPHNSGWVLWEAMGINDSGQIVGAGVKDGSPRAFLITPVACPADLAGPGATPTPDGLLDNNDFIVFIDAFFSRSSAADIGSQGGQPAPDGRFDSNDFIVYIDRFFAGC